jgi:subtilisin family serine protease
LHEEESLTVTSAANKTFEIPFRAVRPKKVPSGAVTARLTQKLRPSVQIDVSGVHSRPDGTFVLPVSVSGAKRPSKDLEGTVQIFAGGKPISPPLQLEIRTIAATANMPADVTAPSPDRVANLPSGGQYVVDEIAVTISFDQTDPDALIRKIARKYNLVVQGALSRARIYQLRVPGTTSLERLNQVKAQIAAESGVSSATYNLFTQDPSAKNPNDTKWDSWNVGSPGGNNWNLERTNVPGAWDISTGSRSVKIGVIDGGFNSGIDDLKLNIAKLYSGGDSTHGNHVAGTICAEGDNKQGLTGVMWSCSMNQFYHGSTTVLASAAMVKAADAGDRVVNMSLQFVDNSSNWSVRGYKRPSTDELRLLVDEANKTLRQGILYSKRYEKDVLWVFAAGNESRDASLAAPGGLAPEFPENVVSVAATQPDGTLADFSNRGKVVSVAAPGTDIFSTVGHSCKFLWWSCSDDFDVMSGTSMAAPQIAGLAGLVIAKDPSRRAVKVKQCLVAAAQGSGRAVPGQTFREINAAKAVDCSGGALHLPTKVDVVFSIDLTSSMGSVVDQAKSQLLQAMTGLKNAAPSTDFRFAVTSVMDYPNIYGRPGDYPFKIDAPLNSDATTIQSVVDGLTLGNGGDGPESYGRALWEIGQVDTGAALGFRSDALKLVINFGDNVPHDNDINKDITNPPLSGGTGADPGRDGVVGTADDIDFQDRALTALKAQGIRLLEVDSSKGTSVAPYWQSWTATTGGAYTALTPGDGRSLSTVIVDLLKLIP